MPLYDGPRRRVMLGFSGDKSAQNYSSFAAVVWDSANYDIGGWFDAANKSRITVPPGVGAIKLSAGLDMTGVTASSPMSLIMVRNGDQEGWQRPTLNFPSPPSDILPAISVSSGVLEVTPGWYYELYLKITADSSIGLTGTRCYFGAEEYR